MSMIIMIGIDYAEVMRSPLAHNDFRVIAGVYKILSVFFLPRKWVKLNPSLRR